MTDFNLNCQRFIENNNLPNNKKRNNKELRKLKKTEKIQNLGQGKEAYKTKLQKDHKQFCLKQYSRIVKKGRILKILCLVKL